jgi:hypothetical protein
MAILKIRDADGNVQEIFAIRGNDGKDYVLTEEDKREIAEMVSSGGNIEPPDLSLYALKTEIPDVSGFMTESQVLALIQSNMPVNGDEENY